jgi:REP element-mobilizing transposase RayT
MPRKPRLTGPLTTYHVIVRCNNGDLQLKDRADFVEFLGAVAHYKAIHRFKLFGYTLMNTHAHFIIQTGGNEQTSISRIMHDICLRYAKWFNRSHGRKGHFFNERFKSPVVETDSYGIALLRYIAQNPVRAKMVPRARDWEWSSERIYEDGVDDGLVDLMPSFLGLAASLKRAAAHLRELVDGQLMKQDASWTGTYIIGTERFVKKVLGRYGPSPNDPLIT